MHSAVPKNVPTSWRPSSKPARQLAKRLRKMPLLLKVSARGSRPLRTL
jgi:hypothetical protein